MILVCSVSVAYSRDGGKKTRSFGFSFGCFTPQDINYKDVYGDERDTTFSLFYDKETSGNFSMGTSLMYYEDEGYGVSSAFEQSRVKTEFILLKAELSGVYRAIGYDDQLIVPQFKAGLNCTYFNEKAKGGSSTENAYFGYHAGFALLLLLDRLDTDNAGDLQRGYGIDDTYFFVGMDYSDTDAFKDNKLGLGGVEYNVGLIFRY
jgi:hypothetical protein